MRARKKGLNKNDRSLKVVLNFNTSNHFDVGYCLLGLTKKLLHRQPNNILVRKTLGKNIK